MVRERYANHNQQCRLYCTCHTIDCLLSHKPMHACQWGNALQQPQYCANLLLLLFAHCWAVHDFKLNA
jgi:hypothetical protein